MSSLYPRLQEEKSLLSLNLAESQSQQFRLVEELRLQQEALVTSSRTINQLNIEFSQRIQKVHEDMTEQRIQELEQVRKDMAASHDDQLDEKLREQSAEHQQQLEQQQMEITAQHSRELKALQQHMEKIKQTMAASHKQQMKAETAADGKDKTDHGSQSRTTN